ncbi:MAG: hypothetical protein ACFFD1_13525 [Candidatus Thorarchaeota archaeon]
MSQNKCYIDNKNTATEYCYDCKLPICGAHSKYQQRYVDRYTTDAGFIVCPICFEKYEKKMRVRTPLMIVVSAAFIIITLVLYVTYFNNFIFLP